MRVLFPVLCALALILTGCSIDSAASLNDPSDSPADASEAALDGPLPFDAVLLELLGTTDVTTYLVDLERSASERTAECMREAGFEFDLPAPERTPPSADETETLEYAQTEGFGLVTSFRAAIRTASQSPGDVDDVNRQYLGTLTQLELDRFFMTLNGEPAEPGQLQTETGCRGQSSDEIYADWVEFFEALPQYTAMGEERDTHPDWLAARAEWQRCMADLGYQYDEPDAIRTDVAGRMQELMTGDGQGGVVIETDDGVQLQPEIEMLFDDMLEFERAAAVANFDCTAPLTEVFDRVDFEVQQAFVDRNRAVIDELLGK